VCASVLYVDAQALEFFLVPNTSYSRVLFKCLCVDGLECSTVQNRDLSIGAPDYPSKSNGQRAKKERLWNPWNSNWFQTLNHLPTAHFPNDLSNFRFLIAASYSFVSSGECVLCPVFVLCEYPHVSIRVEIKRHALDSFTEDMWDHVYNLGFEFNSEHISLTKCLEQINYVFVFHWDKSDKHIIIATLSKFHFEIWTCNVNVVIKKWNIKMVSSHLLDTHWKVDKLSILLCESNR